MTWEIKRTDTFSKELDAGLLSRCTVTFVKLTLEQRKEIREFQHLRAGDTVFSADVNLMEEVIIDFYEELKMIQRGKHEEYLKKKFGDNHGRTIIEPVIGYNINPDFKRKWLDILNQVGKRMERNKQEINNRDSLEYYKFLVNIAFLNIHKRKHINGILEPNEEDHRIAKDLAFENMRYKWGLPIALRSNRKVRSLDALEKLLNQGVSEVVKDVLLNISPYSPLLKNQIFDVQERK